MSGLVLNYVLRVLIMFFIHFFFFKKKKDFFHGFEAQKKCYILSTFHHH